MTGLCYVSPYHGTRWAVRVSPVNLAPEKYHVILPRAFSRPSRKPRDTPTPLDGIGLLVACFALHSNVTESIVFGATGPHTYFTFTHWKLRRVTTALVYISKPGRQSFRVCFERFRLATLGRARRCPVDAVMETDTFSLSFSRALLRSLSVPSNNSVASVCPFDNGGMFGISTFPRNGRFRAG